MENVMKELVDRMEYACRCRLLYSDDVDCRACSYGVCGVTCGEAFYEDIKILLALYRKCVLVPSPVKIGSKIYVPVELGGRWFVDACTVTEVGTRYVLVSSFAVPRDDLGDAYLLADLGKKWFLSYEEAAEHLE